MPAFEKFLSDVQTTQVIAYVRSLAAPPLRARPPALAHVAGAPAQWAFPAADTLAGARYAAHRFLGRIRACHTR